MTHLDAILGTLLLRNNCVVIPSFGGFVANNVSAKVDVKNGLITPPSKALSFNKNLNNNDGLIISQLASDRQISFDEAQNIISKEVQQIKAQLGEGKRVHFHNVGFLYINTAGKIAFEQDRFFNLLLSSYGMGNVQFISEEEKVEKIAPIEIDKPSISTNTIIEVEHVQEDKTTDTKEIEHPAVASSPSRNVLRKLMKYAAVAALVPVAFYSFWIPMKTDVLQSGVVYADDFNPFKNNVKAVYEPAVKVEQLTAEIVTPSNELTSITENISSSSPIFTYPLDEDLFIPVWRKVENTSKTEVKEEIINAIPSNSYHAIVGCFSNPSNASDLIKELKSKGFNAYKVDVKGRLHRVSAGNVTERSQISSLKQQLKPTGLPVWILKK